VIMSGKSCTSHHGCNGTGANVTASHDITQSIGKTRKTWNNAIVIMSGNSKETTNATTALQIVGRLRLVVSNLKLLQYQQLVTTNGIFLALLT
jgi:hypothetical protein